MQKHEFLFSKRSKLKDFLNFHRWKCLRVQIVVDITRCTAFHSSLLWQFKICLNFTRVKNKWNEMHESCQIYHFLNFLFDKIQSQMQFSLPSSWINKNFRLHDLKIYSWQTLKKFIEKKLSFTYFSDYFLSALPLKMNVTSLPNSIEFFWTLNTFYVQSLSSNTFIEFQCRYHCCCFVVAHFSSIFKHCWQRISKLNWIFCMHTMIFHC